MKPHNHRGIPHTPKAEFPALYLYYVNIYHLSYFEWEIYLCCNFYHRYWVSCVLECLSSWWQQSHDMAACLSPGHWECLSHPAGFSSPVDGEAIYGRQVKGPPTTGSWFWNVLTLNLLCEGKEILNVSVTIFSLFKSHLLFSVCTKRISANFILAFMPTCFVVAMIEEGNFRKSEV